MEENRNRIRIKRAIYFGFLLLLTLPFVQSQFSLFNTGKLEGAFISKGKPFFNSDGWFSGKYQEKEEEYLNESFGFRNFMVRLHNQISFSFFGKANADNIVIGKNNYLFQRPSITSFYGLNFLGEDYIEHRIIQLKYISDTLAKLNKNMIVVFGAGKASFFSQYILEKMKYSKGPNNMEYHIKFAEKYGLNFIDFNKYFIDEKNHIPYPLFPQFGIHWSRYGGYVVTDSLLHYIEFIRHIDLPDLVVDTIKMRRPENEDYDIAGGMNLLFRLKSYDMAYPEVHYANDSAKTKPSVLVIGDSYYWGLMNMDISKAFSRTDFWFYNKRGTAGALKVLDDTTKFRMASEVNKYDVIILIATEANLADLGWGFIESTYCYYKGIDMSKFDEYLFNEEVENNKSIIRNDTRRMKQIIELARSNKISVDSAITLRAVIRAERKRGR